MPSFDTVKMEDRKRPALDHVDASGPPLKRQALVNGSGNHPDADMPWREEIEEYQKDAILRQMREYKREASSLESQLSEHNQKAAYHDEHLRLIDAWFSQLIDEVALLANVPAPSHPPFNSALLAADNETFNRHLKDRTEHIRSTIERIFSSNTISPPDVNALQERIASLLAAQKAQGNELQRVISDRDQNSSRLENAVARYMIAEKKLDRVKSVQVAKVEALVNGTSRPEANGATSKDSAKGDGSHDTNGLGQKEPAGEAIEAARNEARAVSAKRAEQIDRLAEENKKLTEQLTLAQQKATTVTDDDYAHTELFKSLKAQHQDVIKRINDLEATNVQLREEAKQLHAERTAYREETDKELQNATVEMETQMAQRDTDLARIRHARDELSADIAKVNATQEQHRVSADQIKHLAEAREERIKALESEAERLRSAGQVAAEVTELSTDELNGRLKHVENEKSMLESELRSMEQAWKKAQTAASKKITEVLDAEEKISRLCAEKAKADQKYFGAMKAKETREQEIRALRQQNSKSSEIVSQLKEAEGTCRGYLANLEKQLAEARDNLASVTNQQRSSHNLISEQKVTVDRLTSQVGELQKLLTGKDSGAQAATQAQMKAEVEAAELKSKLADTEKSLESWKKRGVGSQNEEYEVLRGIALCPVCRNNFKDMAIKTCGHVLCHECIESRMASRMRKCPSCNKPFGRDDIMRVTL